MKAQTSTFQGRWGLLLGALAMAACEGVATMPPSTTVAGLVLNDDVTQGTVSLRDSSTPPQERSTLVRSNGAYTIDFAGLTPPFVLRAEVTTGSETVLLYTIPGDEIATNLSSLSTAAVAAATMSGRASDAYDQAGHGGATVSRFQQVFTALRSVLKPLFDLYQVPEDPFGDDGMDSALRAMLRDVTISIHDGTVVVTNRRTGGVIFEGPLSDLASGTFHPENLPPGPGTPNTPPSTDGVALYAATCAKCHGALPGDVGGSSAAEIRSAIASNRGGMGKLRNMTDAQLGAIAQALSSSSPPTSCTSFTYSAWSTCTNGTQTRTVTSSSPAGCTGGSPVLSQTCTDVPPSTTCTSFTYSAWSTCANGTQTRTVTSSSPAGCTGGSPVLSQSCTAIDGAALYNSKCASCHGALASSEVRGTTASAIVGKHGTKYGTSEQMTAIAAALK